jgi:hypothetical protein
MATYMGENASMANPQAWGSFPMMGHSVQPPPAQTSHYAMVAPMPMGVMPAGAMMAGQPAMHSHGAPQMLMMPAQYVVAPQGPSCVSQCIPQRCDAPSQMYMYNAEQSQPAVQCVAAAMDPSQIPWNARASDPSQDMTQHQMQHQMPMKPHMHQMQHQMPMKPHMGMGVGGGVPPLPVRAPRKTEVPVARLRKVLAFIQQVGRRPTRKSEDPTEKTLGIWLHRFICNDDGVKDRARGAMPADEFEFIVGTIEKALDAKQVADKAIALANIEAIARRAFVLKAVPLRGDPSGCGKKLHNVRQV